MYNRPVGMWMLLMAMSLLACNPYRHIQQQAHKLLQDSATQNAHLGISIMDAATGKYLYNHDGHKYFIPASNVKIFTCYAGMKYLGDSLPGITYYGNDTALWLQPTGDPTLLHPDFKNQPVLSFLQQQKKSLYINKANWQEDALGYGWAWNDYSDDYMAERSPLPVYGNTVRYTVAKITYNQQPAVDVSWSAKPPSMNRFANTHIVMPDYLQAKLSQPALADTSMLNRLLQSFRLTRIWENNQVSVLFGGTTFKGADIPLRTDTLQAAIDILRNDHGIILLPVAQPATQSKTVFTIKSQPTDSMLKPMMRRSDNFYAEQTLLMVSQLRLGKMNCDAIVDTLLKTDLKELPQRPRWVDGSGLSRYNLATPQSIVHLLRKMQQEFGTQRLETVFATGGTGTINNYYKTIAGSIFAKTGTLSNNCALSGYLTTKKGKRLIFSVLANQYPGGATAVRRAVERFLLYIYQEY